MPVRSRGSLLAGTAILTSLLLAGIGCHSSPSDTFSPTGAAVAPAPPAPVAAAATTAHPVGVPGSPSRTAAYQTPAVRYGPPAGSVTLQPVPTAQAANNREVIASTYQPVQRVSAEQTVPGPQLQSLPAAVVARMPGGAAMPIGSPTLPGNRTMPAVNGPLMDANEVPMGDEGALHAPRPLGSTGTPMVIADGAMPPGAVMGMSTGAGMGMPPGMAPPHKPMPREFEKMPLPPYVVEPPDILLIQASDRITLRLQRVEGQHLVAPDGTINLGIYGKVRVVGMTLDQVADAVANRLLQEMPGLLRNVKMLDPKTGEETKEDADKYFRTNYSRLELIKKEMQVDVLSYNSKYYYVITDGGGYGQQVYPFLVTGNETVLDALARVTGLPAVANKKRIWVARATRAGQPHKILPVDWKGVTMCGESATNYQIFPGDRIYVDSDKWFKADAHIARRLSPIQRLLGVTLLGASTVNAIKGTSTGSGLGGVGFR